MALAVALLTFASVFIACLSLDCNEITESDMANVIAAVVGEEGSPAPTITITKQKAVCLAHSQQRDLYRYVSVVVEYTCSGSSRCPTKSPAVEQFESQCDDDGKWSNEVAYSTINTRTIDPMADFSTTTRNDCTFCLSQELINEIFYPFGTDSITHCVACSQNCSDGHMRCYQQGAHECCNYYNDSACVHSCPVPFLPNEEHDCVNETDDYCSEQIIINCGQLKDPIHGVVSFNTTCYSVAYYYCNAGYSLTGNMSRTCLDTGDWSGSEPICSVVDCGPLDDPENGTVSVTTTTYKSVANYSCNHGYTLTGIMSRICLKAGVWSGSTPECSSGKRGISSAIKYIWIFSSLGLFMVVAVVLIILLIICICIVKKRKYRSLAVPSYSSPQSSD